MVPASSWHFVPSSDMASPGEPPVIGKGQTLCTRLRGITFSMVMLLSALFGAIYIITPMIPLLFWNPKLWRKCMDRLIGFWVMMPSALMAIWFGSEVHVKGDMIEHTEPALIIMNHRTRLDWLFFWNALYKMDPWICTSEKISLKGILKYVPGAGWAMGSAAYIFLDRSYESDKEKLNLMLDYYATVGYNYQLLLFPEGTDKCPKATERSKSYAEKNGLIHYDYVLHPRTTGFVHIVQSMRNANYLKYIYDVTIGFEDSIVQSEVDLVVHGVAPRQIHYQVRKIPIEQIPKDDDKLADWLIALWEEKERKLREFYSKTGTERQFEGGEEYKMTDQTRLMQIMIVVVWMFTTLFWILCFVQIPFMFIFGIFACAVFAIIQKLYGGIEWLAVQKFRDWISEPVPLDPATNGRLPVPSS